MEKMEGSPRLQNPLTLKVGQVMTGFGIGCGVGIGVGRPLNLGSVPVVGQLAGDVSRSFGPIGWQIHNLMKKFGLKNIEVGVGCGIGLGHGFGIGVALKPGSAEQFKHFTERGVSMLNQRIRSAMGQPPQEEEKPSIVAASGAASGEVKDEGGRLLHNLSSGSTERLEQVSESKQSYYNEVDKVLERLESENKMMRTLLAHQDQIDEIKRQNQELKEAFEERVHKQLGESEASRMCFECRRKLRSRK